MQNVSTTKFDTVRRFVRMPYYQPINYSLSTLDAKERKWLNLKGDTVDISEGGIGILTDYRLEPGNMLWFDEGVEDKAGFVRWCIKQDNGYRAGVELDEKHVKHLDQATDLFNRQLDEIEKRCLNPDVNLEEILNAIDKAIGDVSHAYDRFEKEVQDINILRDARIRFRQKTNHIISKSYFLNRARIWPQGYQGDYKMLEGIYRNAPLSEGIGYYLDLYFQKLPINVSARQRIRKLEDILREELQKRKNPSVLNIACGSCREVFELAQEIEESGAKFTCIDLDNDALSFAANRLSYTNISPLSSNQVVLRKYNALRMFDDELNMSEFGKQDIIYSVGFFDYLETEFLIRMLQALYALLNPGGKIVAAFKDSRHYKSVDRNWLVDWDGFLARTEKDFRQIFFEAGIPDSVISESRVESGIIIFYIITK